MNIAQRVVLVAGSIGMLVLLLITDPPSKGWMWTWQWQPALVRAAIVALATAAVFFAVSKRKP